MTSKRIGAFFIDFIIIALIYNFPFFIFIPVELTSIVAYLNILPKNELNSPIGVSNVYGRLLNSYVGKEYPINSSNAHTSSSSSS